MNYNIVNAFYDYQIDFEPCDDCYREITIYTTQGQKNKGIKFDDVQNLICNDCKNSWGSMKDE